GAGRGSGAAPGGRRWCRPPPTSSRCCATTWPPPGSPSRRDTRERACGHSTHASGDGGRERGVGRPGGCERAGGRSSNANVEAERERGVRVSHPHPELGSPPLLPANGLRVVALGGLGEIGRNMTVLEHAGRLLVVDCGVLFPEDEQPGVDLILPDFSYLEGRLDDIEAVVLTHGHEDHIGGIPYLLRDKP